MSWPLASFAVVAAVLLVGWLAYERSRPSARAIALVATLAALAALGRDAFAAVPEVKPITAMTFVVGYTLGPLPGFVVGAIGMLVSNMMLGQGPYTPWQMAAWGGVGLIGALFGILSRRRLRRLSLALGCALAATIAMAIMDLYEWSVGAAHTPAALLAIAGSAVPFDVVDIGSTFLFGLLFGPELARLLARVRARMTVSFERAGTVAPAALALLLAVSGPVAPGGHGSASTAGASALTARASAVRAAQREQLAGDIVRGVAYLRSAQNADGGFGEARAAPSSDMFTAWAAIGLAAAGRQPLALVRDGRSLLEELTATASSLHGAGDEERTILALHACGLPAGRLAGVDLAARLLHARQADGSFEGDVSTTSFAVFALRALGRGAADPVLRRAAVWIARQQNPDGGFSFAAKGDASDVDDTAVAIEAIVDAGLPDRAGIDRAVAYLRRAERAAGGFPQRPGGPANAQSTAWAVQGLVAAGARLSHRGRSPIAYLQGLIASNGSVRYARGATQTPVWVTSEALAAFAGRPLPIAPAGGVTVRVKAGVEELGSQWMQAIASMLGARAVVVLGR